MENKKLFRSVTDKEIGGVCGGIAQYLGIDSTWVRIFFVVLLVFTGIGFALYLILWALLPREDQTGDPGSFSVRAQGMGSDLREAVRRPNPHANMYIGIALVGLGVFFLLENLNIPWLNWINHEMFWPLVLVAAGVVLLVRAFRR